MKSPGFILLLVVSTFLFAPRAFSQKKLATVEVSIPKVQGVSQIPVSVLLDEITPLRDSTISVVEVQGKKRIPIPFQVTRSSRMLEWVANTEDGIQKKVYEVVKGPSSQPSFMKAEMDTEWLTLKADDKNLLRYYHKTLYPPSGVDTAYKRSGFIHPLWSPHGQVLTRVQPPDHYHHYGIWNPWTHTLYKGDTVDFWNIAGRKGTVRFSKFLHTTSGPLFSEFQVLHEHVVTKKNSPEEVALNELQTIRVYKPVQDYYIVDIISNLRCATESPMTLLMYRYGGLGWRTTEQWDKNNSEVITSEGKGRKEADGSKARWCIVQGTLDQDYGGVVMMSDPSNYNHPEPLRIWPENQYDRGDMFANFSPTKDRDWDLVPGKEYVLKYRLVVFNGHMDKEKAEALWNAFVLKPEITIKK